MDFAVIDMEEEGSIACQHTLCLDESRLEESEIVVEGIIVGSASDLDRSILLTLESDAIAIFLITNRFQLDSGLCTTSIEWRIDIYQIHLTIREAPENL